jgi:hypothetical protein
VQGQLDRVAPFCFCGRQAKRGEAESGGEMGKSLVDRKAEEEERKKRGRPKKALTSAGNKEDAAADAGGKKPSRATKKAAEKTEGKGEAKKPTAKDALQEAVEEQVLNRTLDIAVALVEKMIGGSKHSADLVMSLVDEKEEHSGASRHDGLTADDLPGSEEDWESESWIQAEGRAETGTGGNEPEGE